MDNSKTNHIFFVGPVKSGTTRIYRSLLRNTNCSMIPGKEIYYFDDNFTDNIKDYLSNFKIKNRTFVDISPTYFSNKKSAIRIKKFFPNAKIVIIIRNHQDLIISQYKYALRHGHQSNLSLQEFISLESNKIYIDRLKYMNSIPFWEELFGVDNVIFVNFTELMTDYTTKLPKLCELLGIEITNNELDEKKINSSAKKPSFPNIYRNINKLGGALIKIMPKHVLLRIKLTLVDKVFLHRKIKFKPDASDKYLIESIYSDDIKKLKLYLSNRELL